MEREDTPAGFSVNYNFVLHVFIMRLTFDNPLMYGCFWCMVIEERKEAIFLYPFLLSHIHILQKRYLNCLKEV